jgi:hypothetical protein
VQQGASILYFFGISLGINFLFFSKCFKMYNFFAFTFKVCKKCYYDKKNCFEKYNITIKNAEFYAVYKFIDAAFQICPKKMFQKS